MFSRKRNRSRPKLAEDLFPLKFLYLLGKYGADLDEIAAKAKHEGSWKNEGSNHFPSDSRSPHEKIAALTHSESQQSSSI